MLYDYYHLGDEGSFDFDIKKAKKVGADFRNDLCNGMVKYFPDHFEDESKFCKALFIKKYPSSLSDRFINEITSCLLYTSAYADNEEKTVTDIYFSGCSVIRVSWLSDKWCMDRRDRL